MSASARATLIACLALSPLANGLAQTSQRRPLPELRADVTLGETSASHLGAGVHVATGTYVRLAFLGAAGRSYRDSDGGTSYRLEIQGRFVLDPFRASRFGLYGIGGIATTHDPFTHWQSRLVLGGGVEIPAHGRAALAIEGALAGGFRLSIVTRRLPLGRR